MVRHYRDAYRAATLEWANFKIHVSPTRYYKHRRPRTQLGLPWLYSALIKHRLLDNFINDNNVVVTRSLRTEGTRVSIAVVELNLVAFQASGFIEV